MAQSNSSTAWQKKGFGWIPDLPDIADPSLTLALDNKPRILSREGIDHLEGIANILSKLLRGTNSDEAKQLEDVYNKILGETRFPNVQVYKILRKPGSSHPHESARIQQAQAKEIVQLKQALYWIYRGSKTYQSSDQKDFGVASSRASKGNLYAEKPPDLLPDKPEEVIEWLQTPEFDNRLEAIVKNFQKQRHLVEDGIVGLRTYIALKAKLANSGEAANEQNVELLCPSSIIPHDILEEVFQQLTYIWLCAKFDLSIDQSFEYFSGQHALAPNQNEYAIRIKVELNAIVHERLREISPDFRKKIKLLPKEAADKEKDIQQLKRQLAKLKAQLIHRSEELAIATCQELESQFQVNENLGESENSIHLQERGETSAPTPGWPIFKDLHETLMFNLDKLDKSLCGSNGDQATLDSSFILYSDDEFIKQFHTWFHIIEPFVSAIFQIISPLANFDNYRQAVCTGFDKLDSCFQMRQLEYASKIASYKNLLLEYSSAQTVSQIEELQELRQTIFALFQETIAKINRIRIEDLNYRHHILNTLEKILKSNITQLDKSTQEKDTLVKKWKYRSANVPSAWLDEVWRNFLPLIEDQLLRFEDKKEEKENEQKRRIRSLAFVFIKSRLGDLADSLSELTPDSDLSKSVEAELAKDKESVDSYFSFFEFLSDIVSEKYRVRLKNINVGFVVPPPKPDSRVNSEIVDSTDLADSSQHYETELDRDQTDSFGGNETFDDDVEQSNSQAELVSFLTFKKELFEIQNIDGWGMDAMQLDGKTGKALFFEPTVVQLPINANLMKKAAQQTELPTLPSSKRKFSTESSCTRFYFFLPGLVDLSYWCPPIEDQEDVNACTAFAGVSLLEYFAQKRYGKYTNLSARFLYKTARNLMNRSDDTGASVRQTMKALVLFGVPPEEVWPWRAEDFNEEPPAFCYAYAQSYQALKYFRLDAAGSGTKDTSLTSRELLLFQIKAVLAAGLPCIFGFTVYSSFFKDRNIRLGYIPYPSTRDQVMGGHTAVAVGYNDHKRIDRMDGEPAKSGAVLIRNSWGPSWGNGGYGWMPYEYVLDGLTADWWSLLKSEWFDGGAFGLGAVDPGNSNKPKPSQNP